MLPLVLDKPLQVLHPEKVGDVDLLLRKLAVLSNSNECSAFIVIGAGTYNSYYRDFRHDRELHRIVSYCALKNIPMSNIIAVDWNKDICAEWDKIGISTFCINWEDIPEIRKIAKYVRSLKYSGHTHVYPLLYANTYGGKDNVNLYENWLKIFKPSYFLGLYANRRAFTCTDVWRLTRSYRRYSPIDLGLLENCGKRGIIHYNGMFLAVLGNNGRAITGVQ